jgi:hypothetical protein
VAELKKDLEYWTKEANRTQTQHSGYGGDGYYSKATTSGKIKEIREQLKEQGLNYSVSELPEKERKKLKAFYDEYLNNMAKAHEIENKYLSKEAAAKKKEEDDILQARLDAEQKIADAAKKAVDDKKKAAEEFAKYIENIEKEFEIQVKIDEKEMDEDFKKIF